MRTVKKIREQPAKIESVLRIVGAFVPNESSPGPAWFTFAWFKYRYAQGWDPHPSSLLIAALKRQSRKTNATGQCRERERWGLFG